MSLSNHTLILKNDGTLWGCGRNDHGELGLGDTNNRNALTKITTNANDVKSIYCGYNHTIILKNDGMLFGCGLNNYGQLGLGDTDNRSTFTIIGINSGNIKEIYLGGEHTIILKNDGTLWGCGRNIEGQLGVGDTNSRSIFKQITVNTDNIKSVYCGYNYTLILKNDNTLWGCGDNTYGQLGLEDRSSRTTFTKITANADNIKSVYCGAEQTFILKNDGTLWGCGYNGYGQLCLGDTTYRSTFKQITTNANNIKSIYCGYYYILIVKNDDTLWGCGDNRFGQLDLGDTKDRTTFTQSAVNIHDMKSIYCGSSYVLMLKSDGTLWGCGWNERSSLGLGDATNRKAFTQITTNADNIKGFANDYNTPSAIKIYDSKIGYAETIDTNNFRNIHVDKFEKLKVLYVKPLNTYANCLISFDKKQTWKTFNGTTWTAISNTTPSNIILNCMDIETLNHLTKQDLVQAGFVGDLDFKVAIKTNDEKVTSSISKIYIVYKNPS